MVGVHVLHKSQPKAIQPQRTLVAHGEGETECGRRFDGELEEGKDIRVACGLVSRGGGEEEGEDAGGDGVDAIVGGSGGCFAERGICG